MSESVKLDANEVLMNEGEESQEMYYLVSGNLAVFKRKGDHQQQIGTIMAGELVGEMSFLDGHPRCATVKAITDSELVVVPRDKFVQMIDSHPKWFRALLNTLLERLRKANARAKI